MSDVILENCGCCLHCGGLHPNGNCPVRRRIYTRLELVTDGGDPGPDTISITNLPDIIWENNGFSNEWNWFALTLPNILPVNGIINSNVPAHRDCVDGIELLCEQVQVDGGGSVTVAPTCVLACYRSDGLHLNLPSTHAVAYAYPICANIPALKGAWSAGYYLGRSQVHGFCIEVDADIYLELRTFAF